MDANRTKDSYVRETTFNVTPATPNWKQILLTQDRLTGQVLYQQSRIITSSPRVRDMIRVGREAGGEWGFEFLWANFDDLLEGLLFSTWVPSTVRYNDGTADSQITDVAAGTGVFTVLTNASNRANNYGAYAVAQLVRTTGFSNAGNNTLKRVTAATGTSFTVSAAGLVNEASPAAEARAKVVGCEAPAVGNIAATTSGGNQITGTGVDFTAIGIVPGMWFKASAFPTAANNGWYRAETVSATVILCDVVPTGFATDTAAAAQVRLWFGDYIRDGILAMQSYSFERQLQDLTIPEYDYFTGMCAGSWGLEFTPREILRCTMGFTGGGFSNTTTRFAGSTDDAADILGAIPRTGDVYSASAHVGAIYEGGTQLTTAVVSRMAYDIQLNLRGRPVVGSEDLGSVGRGRVVPAGQLTQYYLSNSLRTKLIASTNTSVTTRLSDPNGTRAFIIDLPKVKFNEGNLEGIEIDSDRTLPLRFTGLEHQTLNCAIQLMRIEEYA